ncbi:MAG: efflux RND transporter periplasmic adaptor subunit [Deltaproteobacteria bacterium]|nr:efflux RND transporter periplasmic adaptor subunit [Deltaproteobacteria bacterium]
MSARWLSAAAALLALGAAGCPRDKGKAHGDPPASAVASAAHHEGEGEHDTIPKRAKLPKEVIDGAKIRTEPAKKESLAPTLALPGEISADPDRSARVSSPVAGRLVDVRFREGSNVKKGDVLAVLRIPEIGKVRAGHSATVAKAAAARANADRVAGLAEKGLAPKQEALSAKAEADALEAEAKALGEQLSALGMGASGGGSELALRAPVAGTVVARDAVVGQPIGTEQTIASIADLSEVWFLARVFEKDLGRLETGATAEVTLNAYPSERWDGKVEYVGKQIDPVSRTVNARLHLTNKDDLLRIGLFGTAHVVAKPTSGRAAAEPVLVVPRSALSEVAGKTVVFVAVGDGEFETHEVTPGDAAAGRVRILAGLREGEPVVVDGAFTIKSVLLRGTLAGED